MYTLIIFVPDKLKLLKSPGYLWGRVDKVKNDINFYIIDKVSNISELTYTNDDFKIIGFDCVDNINTNSIINSLTNFISISQSEEIEWHIILHDIKLRNRMISSPVQPTIVYYDYNAFLISYIDNNKGINLGNTIEPYDHFVTLSEIIKIRENQQELNKVNRYGPTEFIKKLILQIFFISLLYISTFLNYISIIGKYSAFFRNLRECIDGIIEIHEKGGKYE